MCTFTPHDDLHGEGALTDTFPNVLETLGFGVIYRSRLRASPLKCRLSLSSYERSSAEDLVQIRLKVKRREVTD